jgi:peptide/nickel transport system permease protein
MIILTLVLVTALGGGIRKAMRALGVAMMPADAWLMCGETLLLKEHDYVLAGRAAGASNLIEDGWPYLLTNPLLSSTLRLSIMSLAFAFNMAGDRPRDAYSLRLRGTI